MSYDWKKAEMERLQKSLREETYALENGVLCWSSLRSKEDRPVPVDIFRDAGVVPPAGQKAACEAHSRAALASYCKAAKNHIPSGEELFEMRAAFGPGAKVVNVLTGRQIKL